jgi:peptidoglycan/xylan/chitin deacetylase (PgdA/CDA1 family)
VRDALVLCYHGVSEEWPSDLAVRPADLEAQVAHFLARGYRPVTFTEAVTGRSRERVLAVTFDDAYRSLTEIAHPLLARMNVPATVFAPTAFVGEEEPRGWEGTSEWVSTQWAPEIRVMGWDELERLAAAGWEVGSHTRTHPRLPTLGGDELAAELRGSKEDIERALGRPCVSIAYPYGETDRRVAEAAAAVGFSAGGGLLPNRLRARDPLLFPRIFAGRHTRDSALFRRSRPLVRALQGSRLWPTMRRVAEKRRSLLGPLR